MLICFIFLCSLVATIKVSTHITLCPSIDSKHSLINAMCFSVMCLSIGTPKIINFPLFQRENLLFLGVPKSGHITA